MTPSTNHFDLQHDDNGRPFRYIATKRDGTMPPKWINRVEKWCWVHLFRWEDNRKMFTYREDYNGRLTK